MTATYLWRHISPHTYILYKFTWVYNVDIFLSVCRYVGIFTIRIQSSKPFNQVSDNNHQVNHNIAITFVAKIVNL